ncbi:hypothetical protein ACJX0J_014854 [Zea mays]
MIYAVILLPNEYQSHIFSSEQKHLNRVFVSCGWNLKRIIAAQSIQYENEAIHLHQLIYMLLKYSAMFIDYLHGCLYCKNMFLNVADGVAGLTCYIWSDICVFLTREDFIILFEAAWALTNIVVIDHVFTFLIAFLNNKIQAIIEAGVLKLFIYASLHFHSHYVNSRDIRTVLKNRASKSEITNIQMIGSLRYLCLKLYLYTLSNAHAMLQRIVGAFVVVTLYAFFLFAIIPHVYNNITYLNHQYNISSLHGTSMRMNHFVINFQYYIMFEIIAESDIVLPSLL